MALPLWHPLIAVFVKTKIHKFTLVNLFDEIFPNFGVQGQGVFTVLDF